MSISLVLGCGWGFTQPHLTSKPNLISEIKVNMKLKREYDSMTVHKKRIISSVMRPTIYSTFH